MVMKILGYTIMVISMIIGVPLLLLGTSIIVLVGIGMAVVGAVMAGGLVLGSVPISRVTWCKFNKLLDDEVEKSIKEKPFKGGYSPAKPTKPPSGATPPKPPVP